MSAAVSWYGGMKKSAALSPFPKGVPTAILPEVPPVGTVVVILVAVAEAASALVMLKEMRSLLNVV